MNTFAPLRRSSTHVTTGSSPAPHEERDLESYTKSRGKFGRTHFRKKRVPEVSEGDEATGVVGHILLDAGHQLVADVDETQNVLPWLEEEEAFQPDVVEHPPSFEPRCARFTNWSRGFESHASKGFLLPQLRKKFFRVTMFAQQFEILATEAPRGMGSNGGLGWLRLFLIKSSLHQKHKITNFGIQILSLEN